MTYQTQELNELQALAMAVESRFQRQVISYNVAINIVTSPPPNTYDPIEALHKVSPNKSFSFGISREAYKKVYDKKHPSPDLSIPGPGTYPVTCYLGRFTRTTTFKGRIKNLSILTGVDRFAYCI